MTLAALSPLFIWWPLALAVAFLIARIAVRIGRQQRYPWPPPVVLSLPAPVFPWPPPRVA